MQRFATGLEHRLKRARRQMADQHRHLGALRDELGHALQNGVRARARDAVRGYVEAIESHFRLESEVFFPALHGLHPEFRTELEALDRDHHQLLQELRAMSGAVEDGALDRLAPELEEFNGSLREHERREETLVERIVAAGTPPAADPP